jgi:phage tail sheath protein FI
LVAAKFCREHHAILVVDPPGGWDTAPAALEGLKKLNFYSDCATMFFPRIVCMDRLRGIAETFGNGGAVAGLLSRLDESVASIAASNEPEPLLRAGARLAREVSSADRSRLATAGINVLQTVRSAERNAPALRTLACGASASADWAYLAPRRFALFVVGAVERATRWAVMAPNHHGTRERVTAQVEAFLCDLRAAGAFSAAPSNQAFLVICDERINDERVEPGTVNILLQLAAIHAGEYHSFMISHSVHGSTVRPVMVNRLETPLLLSNDLLEEITIRVLPEAAYQLSRRVM